MIRMAGKAIPWRQGMTVADLLREYGDSQDYPVVRINDQYVSRPNYGNTPVPDDVDVFLIPMIAGG